MRWLILKVANLSLDMYMLLSRQANVAKIEIADLPDKVHSVKI